MNCSKYFGYLFIGHALLASATGSPVLAAEACSGIWSPRGKQPHVGDSFTADAIPSPDGKSSLAISEAAVEFIAPGGASAKLDVPVNTALMEIIWSQDSTAFAINVSDGSNAGPWHSYAYRVVADRAAPEPVVFDAEIKTTQTSMSRCDANVRANLALVAWLRDGDEMLLVAETPKLESCKNQTNDLVGFRVSTTSGKILERLSRSLLKERWPNEVRCRTAD